MPYPRVCRTAMAPGSSTRSATARPRSASGSGSAAMRAVLPSSWHRGEVLRRAGGASRSAAGACLFLEGSGPRCPGNAGRARFPSTHVDGEVPMGKVTPSWRNGGIPIYRPHELSRNRSGSAPTEAIEADQPFVRCQHDSRALHCEPRPVCVRDRRVDSAAGHQQADGPPIEDDEQRIGRRAHPESDARRVLPQESDVVAADRDAGRTCE
jgi:hypothetical protein